MNTVFTIGYEGTDIARFVTVLKAVGVEALADVRAVAHSRKKGFSKSALAARLGEEGMSYIHFARLGDPKAGRDAARAGRYNEFRRVYGAHLASVETQAALSSLEQLVRGNSTCMLCFERDPRLCHRSLVADRLKARGIEVVDLYGDLLGHYERFGPNLPHGYPRQGASAAQQGIW